MRAALPLLFAALAVSAQVKETVTVSVVEVPISVVDRDGNPVRGLTADNFELYDAGKRVPIKAFDKIDFASSDSVKAISPLNPAARRNFMLLFDIGFSSPTSLVKAQTAARTFIAQMVQRRDLVAIGTIDVERGFRLLTAFTTDRALLQAAIADPRSFTATDPLQIASAPVLELSKNVSGSETASGRAGAAEEELFQTVARANKLNDNYKRQRIQKELTSLGGVAKMLNAVRGRKQVIFLSEGFDPRLVQGRDTKASREQSIENDAAASGELWNIDADARFGSSESMSLINRMGQLFRRSDVTLHAIDIQGLRIQNDLRSGASSNSNEGLFFLAKPTGGEVFKNTNDLKGTFERLLHEQEVVYVLAFSAPTSMAGKFHDLKVKLVNVAGGRTIARPGYYEAGGESAAERSLSNAQIVLNDIPVADVHIAALAAPFLTSAKNAQVPVILEINGEDLVKNGRGGTSTAEIFVYAFDDEGIVRDSLFQRMGLDLAKVGDKLRAGGIKYYGTLSLPEGKYAVKSLVRVAESDKKGFARADVVVPRADDIALLQPFVYEEPGKWLMVKGGSHDKTNAAYPFEVNGEPFIPAAGVHVKNGEARKFAVFVYNAAPDEMTWETRPAARLVSQVRAAGGTKSVFLLDHVDVGAQSLEVTVRRKGSSEARTSSVAIATP